MTLEILVKFFWINMKKLLESFTFLFDIVSYTILEAIASFYTNRVFILVYAATLSATQKEAKYF